MYYPKIIYENVPYVYFLTCGYLFAFYETWPTITSAALLYCAGSITLVTRSEYRRLDRRKPEVKNISTKYKLPEWLYEYLPYGYFAFAMIIMLKTNLPGLQLFAFCLMILALKNLLFRVNNRRKAKSLF